jgi:hypothetical protein
MDYGLKVIPTEELKMFPLDDSDSVPGREQSQAPTSP